MLKAFGYAVVINILMALMQYSIIDLDFIEVASLDAFFFFLNPFIVFCLNFDPPRERTLLELTISGLKMYTPSIAYMTLAIYWARHTRKILRFIDGTLLYLYVFPSVMLFIFSS